MSRRRQGIKSFVVEDFRRIGAIRGRTKKKICPLYREHLWLASSRPHIPRPIVLRGHVPKKPNGISVEVHPAHLSKSRRQSCRSSSDRNIRLSFHLPDTELPGDPPLC